jgi:hypothetical protein
VQVPASNAATTSAQNTPASTLSAPSAGSVFGHSAGAAASKKSLLPAFATVFAGQSSDKDISEELSSKVDATEQKEAGSPLEERSLELVNARLASFAPLVLSDEKDANPAHSGHTGSVKSSGNVARHRVAADAPSTLSKKQQSASTLDPTPVSIISTLTAVPSAAIVPMQVVAKNISPARETLTPSGLPAAPDSSSGQRTSFDPVHQKEELPMQAPAAASEGEASIPRAKLDAQETHHAPDAAAGATASTADLPAPTRENLSQASLSSSEAKTSPLLNLADAGSVKEPATVEAVGRSIASQISQPAASHPKMQQKADAHAAVDTGSPSAGSASTTWLRANTDTPVVGSPLLRANDSEASSAKKDGLPLDASPFQRLDSGEAPATLLHSSAHQIAVGVHDPSLGWLEVQTQSSAGHISATLTAASSEAHTSLTADMPAMAQYLADRNVSVHSLNVDAQGNMAGGGQLQSGSGHAQQEMAGQREIVTQESRQPVLSGTEELSAMETGRASHISVRA